MRHRFQVRPDLQLTPVEKIRLPLHSRDELPPILAGLQWLWSHPTLKTEMLALIEAVVLADKKATGRPGLHLWQIMVLGVVRLGLDADWDRMEHIANYDGHLKRRRLPPQGAGSLHRLDGRTMPPPVARRQQLAAVGAGGLPLSQSDQPLHEVDAGAFVRRLAGPVGASLGAGGNVRRSATFSGHGVQSE